MGTKCSNSFDMEIHEPINCQRSSANKRDLLSDVTVHYYIPQDEEQLRSQQKERNNLNKFKSSENYLYTGYNSKLKQGLLSKHKNKRSRAITEVNDGECFLPPPKSLKLQESEYRSTTIGLLKETENLLKSDVTVAFRMNQHSMPSKYVYYEMEKSDTVLTENIKNLNNHHTIKDICLKHYNTSRSKDGDKIVNKTPTGFYREECDMFEGNVPVRCYVIKDKNIKLKKPNINEKIGNSDNQPGIPFKGKNISVYKLQKNKNQCSKNDKESINVSKRTTTSLKDESNLLSSDVFISHGINRKNVTMYKSKAKPKANIKKHNDKNSNNTSNRTTLLKEEPNLLSSDVFIRQGINCEDVTIYKPKVNPKSNIKKYSHTSPALDTNNCCTTEKLKTPTLESKFISRKLSFENDCLELSITEKNCPMVVRVHKGQRGIRENTILNNHLMKGTTCKMDDVFIKGITEHDISIESGQIENQKSKTKIKRSSPSQERNIQKIYESLETSKAANYNLKTSKNNLFKRKDSQQNGNIKQNISTFNCETYQNTDKKPRHRYASSSKTSHQQYIGKRSSVNDHKLEHKVYKSIGENILKDEAIKQSKVLNQENKSNKYKEKLKIKTKNEVDRFHGANLQICDIDKFRKKKDIDERDLLKFVSLKENQHNIKIKREQLCDKNNNAVDSSFKHQVPNISDKNSLTLSRVSTTLNNDSKHSRVAKEKKYSSKIDKTKGMGIKDTVFLTASHSQFSKISGFLRNNNNLSSKISNYSTLSKNKGHNEELKLTKHVIKKHSNHKSRKYRSSNIDKRKHSTNKVEVWELLSNKGSQNILALNCGIKAGTFKNVLSNEIQNNKITPINLNNHGLSANKGESYGQDEVINNDNCCHLNNDFASKMSSERFNNESLKGNKNNYYTENEYDLIPHQENDLSSSYKLNDRFKKPEYDYNTLIGDKTSCHPKKISHESINLLQNKKYSTCDINYKSKIIDSNKYITTLRKSANNRSDLIQHKNPDMVYCESDKILHSSIGNTMNQMVTSNTNFSNSIKYHQVPCLVNNTMRASDIISEYENKGPFKGSLGLKGINNTQNKYSNDMFESLMLNNVESVIKPNFKIIPEINSSPKEYHSSVCLHAIQESSGDSSPVEERRISNIELKCRMDGYRTTDSYISCERRVSSLRSAVSSLGRVSVAIQTEPKSAMHNLSGSSTMKKNLLECPTIFKQQNFSKTNSIPKNESMKILGTNRKLERWKPIFQHHDPQTQKGHIIVETRPDSLSAMTSDPDQYLDPINESQGNVVELIKSLQHNKTDSKTIIKGEPKFILEDSVPYKNHKLRSLMLLPENVHTLSTLTEHQYSDKGRFADDLEVQKTSISNIKVKTVNVINKNSNDVNNDSHTNLSRHSPKVIKNIIDQTKNLPSNATTINERFLYCSDMTSKGKSFSITPDVSSSNTENQFNCNTSVSLKTYPLHDKELTLGIIRKNNDLHLNRFDNKTVPSDNLKNNNIVSKIQILHPNRDNNSVSALILKSKSSLNKFTRDLQESVPNGNNMEKKALESSIMLPQYISKGFVKIHEQNNKNNFKIDELVLQHNSKMQGTQNCTKSDGIQIPFEKPLCYKSTTTDILKNNSQNLLNFNHHQVVSSEFPVNPEKGYVPVSVVKSSFHTDKLSSNLLLKNPCGQTNNTDKKLSSINSLKSLNYGFIGSDSYSKSLNQEDYKEDKSFIQHEWDDNSNIINHSVVSQPELGSFSHILFNISVKCIEDPIMPDITANKSSEIPFVDSLIITPMQIPTNLNPFEPNNKKSSSEIKNLCENKSQNLNLAHQYHSIETKNGNLNNVELPELLNKNSLVNVTNQQINRQSNEGKTKISKMNMGITLNKTISEQLGRNNGSTQTFDLNHHPSKIRRILNSNKETTIKKADKETEYTRVKKSTKVKGKREKSKENRRFFGKMNKMFLCNYMMPLPSVQLVKPLTVKLIKIELKTLLYYIDRFKKKFIRSPCEDILEDCLNNTSYLTPLNLDQEWCKLCYIERTINYDCLRNILNHKHQGITTELKRVFSVLGLKKYNIGNNMYNINNKNHYYHTKNLIQLCGNGITNMTIYHNHMTCTALLNASQEHIHYNTRKKRREYFNNSYNTDIKLENTSRKINRLRLKGNSTNKMLLSHSPTKSVKICLSSFISFLKDTNLKGSINKTPTFVCYCNGSNCNL